MQSVDANHFPNFSKHISSFHGDIAVAHCFVIICDSLLLLQWGVIVCVPVE